MNDTPRPSPSTPRNELIARNVVYLTAGQVLSTALGLVLTATLGRTLGPSDFGIYFIIITIGGLAALIVDWGQATYVIKEIARGRADQASFLGSAVLIRTVFVFIAAVASAALAIVCGYPAIVVWLTPLGVICALPSFLSQLLGYLFRGKDRTELDVAVGLIAKFLAVVATILALQMGGGITAAVLVPTLGGVAALVFAVAMAQRLGVKVLMPVPATVRELVLGGAPIVIMSLSISLHGFLDVTLLSLLSSSEVVGWHGAARAIIGLLLAPATILATASFPELCRVAHSPQDLRQVMSSSARFLLAAGALGFCGLFSFADAAVGIIYGPGHFDPTALILKVCAPFLPIFFLNLLIGNAALATGKSKEIAIGKVVCIAISVVISWFLIGMFQARIGNGAVGLMISSGATELLMSLAVIAILPRGIFTGAILAHLLRAYISAGAVLLLAAFIVPVSAIWISLPIVVVAFVGASVLTGLIAISDIQAVVTMGRSLLNRLHMFKA